MTRQRLDLFETARLFLWSIIAQKRLSGNTQKAYEQDLKVFVDFYNKYTGKTLLQDFYIFLKNQNISDSTIARRFSTVIQFMKYCCREKRTEFNLDLFDLSNKPNIKLKQTYSTFLETDHLDKIRSVLGRTKSDIRLRAIIEILYSTGLRISELLGLKGSDLTQIELHKRLLITGKGGNQRYVFFNDLSMQKLFEYVSMFNVEHDGFLFYGRSFNIPITRQRVFQLLKSVADKAGVDRDVVFPHSFRHRMLTDLVNGNADLISVQKIAGHKKLNTTASYTHVDQRLHEDLAKYHPLSKISKKKLS